MFDREEIENIVQEKFDKTFGLWKLFEYNNDFAISYIVGWYQEKEDAEFSDEQNKEIRYNNAAYNIIDEYMISMGVKPEEKVWIDVTW